MAWLEVVCALSENDIIRQRPAPLLTAKDSSNVPVALDICIMVADTPFLTTSDLIDYNTAHMFSECHDSLGLLTLLRLLRTIKLREFTLYGGK